MRSWGRAFAVASLVHLTLPDVRQEGWLLPALLEGAGALWLLWRPAPGAFALCLLGTAWPLLLLRDVLTQSTYLAACAALGLAGALRPAREVRAAVVWLTGGLYLLAAFHKLNREFLDPTWSCANHAWTQVMTRWPVPDLGAATPWLALVLEVAVGVAVLRRSPWRWPLGLAFHLPLTVTLAPAFGPVMLAGFVAATTRREAARWRRVWRARKRWLAAAALAAGALDLAFAGLDPVALPKVMVAGALLAWSLLAWGRIRLPSPSPAWVRLVAAAWLVHGLTPYFGLQYQHTAAMLSNLRIDDGCHNHLLMPPALVKVDPYLRIDEARVGDRPERERVVRETLWNVAALHTMRRNWCIPENRPIRLAGTSWGRAFVVADLCAADWLDALPHLAGRPAGLQLFQKNLLRVCPAACVH